jgi:hypothetical protein
VAPVEVILIASAAGWGVLLLILAIFLPVEDGNTGRPGIQPMYSLVHVNGYRVLLPASAPLAIAIVVGFLLYIGRGRSPRHWTLITSWILSAVVLAAALIGFVTFLIGIYVVPVGGLLVAAVASAAAGRPRGLPGDLPLESGIGHNG